MSSSSSPSTVAKPKSETLTFRLSSSRIFSGWRKIFEHQLTMRFSNAKCPLPYLIKTRNVFLKKTNPKTTATKEIIKKKIPLSPCALYFYYV